MSPNLLHIETATQFCSVALSIGNKIVEVRATNEKNAHSRVITTFVDEVLKSAKLKPELLDGICVSKGPGSYTGLRIGVSTAKGLCYALDKPLIAIGTLQSMANGMLKMVERMDVCRDEILLYPMIDARRMEVYSAVFSMDLEETRSTQAEIIEEGSFSEYAEKHTLVFAGDGAEKCKAVLSDRLKAMFLDDFQPGAEYMLALALEKYNAGQFEDVAYFEPFYLKDFIAGIPRVKGLHS